MSRILVVDDEPKIVEAIGLLLRHAGYEVEVAGTGRAALQVAETASVEVALLDMALPDMNGLELLDKLRQRDPRLPCIVITAFGTIRSAVDAMKRGVFDYLSKPFDNAELLVTVRRALDMRRLDERVAELEGDLRTRTVVFEILGESDAIRDVLRALVKASATDATVLLAGESGTGKELAARTLHRLSRRAKGPFIAVNCAAIPATLAEAEFFGHERGAFTDAREAREGYFERANSGTLFLDEVGELTLETQAKLLRVLQDHQVTKVAGRQPKAVDVRVVAATNRDLRQAVLDRKFRDDLYWRLNVFPLRLPTLRERKGDLDILIPHFIDRINLELGTKVAGLAPSARAGFDTYDWPGNVRELENALRYAMIMADGGILQSAHFPDILGAKSEPAASHVGESLNQLVARSTARIERAAIEAELKRQRGNRTATAAALGVSRRTLFTKLRALGLVSNDAIDDEEVS